MTSSLIYYGIVRVVLEREILERVSFYGSKFSLQACLSILGCPICTNPEINAYLHVYSLLNTLNTSNCVSLQRFLHLCSHMMYFLQPVYIRYNMYFHILPVYFVHKPDWEKCYHTIAMTAHHNLHMFNQVHHVVLQWVES